MSTTALSDGLSDGLPEELEDICQIIDRLELHRMCLDEALADAYAELVTMLGHYLPADPELGVLLADRPWLSGIVAPVPGRVPRPVMTSSP
jgi:hypothetical protein